LFPALLYAFQLTNNDQAVNFLKSLSDEQREIAQFHFNDLSRTDWHYLPGAMWPRSGIQLHDLNSGQSELLFGLLKSFLSKTGYVKTQKIMDLESVLAEIEGRSTFRDPGKYYVAFYGNPENDSLWAWSFEGHHISLNFSILNNNISIAPRFMGANPATIKEGSRKGERTLAREEDLGYELINNLSEQQKINAVFQDLPFTDIVTSNSSETGPLKPVGIKMEELHHNQRIILTEIINEYVSAMPSEVANKRMEHLKVEDFDEIRFGWAGSLERGKPHYYRVQGKSFLIEFDNTQNNANHIHSVWRDFDGDFGRNLLEEHYQNSSHHH
jgi:hypothetical protein